MSIFWTFFMAACGLLAGLAVGIVVFAFILSVTKTGCDRMVIWIDAQLKKINKREEAGK